MNIGVGIFVVSEKMPDDITFKDDFQIPVIAFQIIGITGPGFPVVLRENPLVDMLLLKQP